MSLSFRRMQAADLDRVMEIEQAAFHDAWTRDMIAAELAPDFFRRPLVMEKDGELCAFAFLWLFEGESHINNFAVHPRFRRKGLGLKFLHYIFERFQHNKEIFLEVRATNTAAINMYRKCGFRQIDLRKKYYMDGEDALVMKKELK